MTIKESEDCRIENELQAKPKRRYWVALFVAAILVVATLGYGYYTHEKERIRLQKYEEIGGIGSLKNASIQKWRKGLLSDVLELSNGPFLKRAVNELLREPSKADLLTGLKDRLVAGQKQGEYADALVLDLDGNVIASASSRPEGINAIEKKAIEEAIASGSPVLSDIYRTPHGAILMDAVAPVVDPEGLSIGIVIYRTSLESVLFPLIQAWPTPSQTAETLLVRRDGDDALFLNDLRHRRNAVLSLREPLSHQDLPAAQAIMGKNGLFQGKDYRGVEVLADLRPIPDSPWFMVTKVDTSEILAEARYRGAIVIIFCGLFVFLSAGLTAYGYRSRQARLYENLYKLELEERKTRAALQDSEQRHRSLVEHLPQRIFIKDRNSVYISCNKNYASVLGIAPEQIVGKDDFAFYPPELAKAYRSDDEDCMDTGIVKELEEIYQAQGQVRWAHTIKVPYRNEQGRIIGVLGIFEDITERKRLQEERTNLIIDLQKALSEVKKLSGFLPICAWCKKIRDDEGYWSEIERYIGEHSETQFSHGICPDCMRKLYPEVADEVLAGLEKDEKK